MAQRRLVYEGKVRGRPGGRVAHRSGSIRHFAELLKLRTLAPSTQAEYVRYLRKLAERVQRDPAELTEPEVRAHLLYLKGQHGHSPSSMRTAVAALVTGELR